MEKNRITAGVNFINGSAITLLENVKPKVALDEYLYPDPGMPITWYLSATSHDGKTVSISIDKDNVYINID